jgi:predicted lipoprotein with Yx(FWY)xxD motif
MKVFPKCAFLVVIGLVLVTVGSAWGGTAFAALTPIGAGLAQSLSLSPTTPLPTAAHPKHTGSFTVRTARAIVNGKATTILTNAQGRTLYYFTLDSASRVACTGTCTMTWHPLLFRGTGKPTASTSLPGVLRVFKDANGNQVTYNGHPLYTFSGDSAAGQTNGEGLFGKWFVATPGLARNKP